MSIIGRNIKKIRNSKKMTQTDLAEKLGTSYLGISQWEIGRRTPRPKNILRIAQALNVKISDIIGLKHEKKIACDELESQLNETYEQMQNPNATAKNINEIKEKQKYLFSKIDAYVKIAESEINTHETEAEKDAPSVINLQLDDKILKIINQFNKLNEDGQHVALAMMQNLTETEILTKEIRSHAL